MNAGAILADLVRLGVPFSARSKDIVLATPSSRLPAELMGNLLAVKSEVLAAAENLAGLVFVDFETRSPLPLRQVGARNYIASPGFEVLCLVAVTPEGRQVTWRPGDPEPRALFAAVRGGAPVVAHNAHGFDRLVWERLGWPDPVAWIDTVHLARAAGLPARLEELGQLLLGVGKDAEGHRLTLAINRADLATGLLPGVSADEVRRVVNYCKHDVHLHRTVFALALKPYATIEPDNSSS